MPRSAALATATLTVLAIPAEGQALRPAFDRLGEAIGRVVAVLPEDDRSLDAIQSDTSALREAASRMQQVDAESYARSIEHDALLLEEAAGASASDRTAIISDVAQDLSIKRRAGTGMGAGTAFTGRIAVVVITRRGTNAVPGYVVALNPVRWAGAAPMFRLPRLSPAEGSVPPGRYEVLASLAGTRKAHDVVPVGLSGEDRVEIDLPVP